MKTQSTILGYIGNEPRTFTFESGRTLVRFSVAVNQFKDGSQSATWYEVQAWNELGAEVYSHVVKGRKVNVIGRPAMNVYKDKQGKEVKKNVINVDYIEFIPKGDQGTGKKNKKLAFESKEYERQMQSA